LHMTGFKKNGIFLEIGANHPTAFTNNTYFLERDYDWRGLMVEYDPVFEYLYKTLRRSDYVITDARSFTYKDYLDKNSYPKNIDYLQIDLDVDNRSTLDVLELLNATVFDDYKFATVTFEHDIYRGDYFETRSTSRKIFCDRGYRLVYPDVKVDRGGGEISQFEDWYIHPSLILRPVQGTDRSMIHEEIIRSLSLKGDVS